MNGPSRVYHVPVVAGAVPVHVADVADPSVEPGVLVVPSIYGPGDELLARMAELTDVASTAVMDPFWRQGGGAVPYDDPDAAINRLADFDFELGLGDVEAVARWMAGRTNGEVVGVGICFGGPFVLIGAAKGWLGAAATWHGSRLELVLDRLESFTAPLRLHFGTADAVTPPNAIDAVRTHFCDHPDVEIIMHEGAGHGFSLRGPAWDPEAASICTARLRDLITRSRR